MTLKAKWVAVLRKKLARNIASSLFSAWHWCCCLRVARANNSLNAITIPQIDRGRLVGLQPNSNFSMSY
jgi:hypothetical protein